MLRERARRLGLVRRCVPNAFCGRQARFGTSRAYYFLCGKVYTRVQTNSHRYSNPARPEGVHKNKDKTVSPIAGILDYLP
jgi:hypothetical protein